MISARQLSSALHGVRLLYQFDVRAWDYFEKTSRGFWSSYVIAVALAPLYLTHAVLQYPERQTGLDLLPYVVVKLLSYVLTWTLFPFVMLYIAPLLNRAPRYLWHVVPYNWMQLPLALPLLVIQVLTDLRVLPPEVQAIVGLLVLVTFAIYGTFVAGIGLQVATGTAVGLVILDYFLGLILEGLVALI